MNKTFALLLLAAFGWSTLFAAERFPSPDWKDEPDPSASPYAVPGGRLVYAGNNPPKSFNGYLDNNTFTQMVFSLLYSTMLSIDPRTGDFGPALADWWEISDDKSTYTFHINPQARWSDGTPVTAHDVKATFDAVTSEKSQAGAYQVEFSALSSPEIIDDLTLRFPCKEVHFRNLAAIGVSLKVMPKALIDQARAECEAKGEDPDLGFNNLNFNFTLKGQQIPLVGGPYYVSEHKEGQYLTLKRRPDWWCFALPSGKGIYNFDEIRIRFFFDQNNAYEAFKKGEVDTYAVYSARIWNTESVGERFEKNWIVKQSIHNHNPIGFQGIAMNMRKPPYDDIRVRKALAMLFDRRRMVRTLMYNSYFMLTSYFQDLYDEQNPCRNLCIEYDPDEALKLLFDAGFSINQQTGKLERDGKPFVVRILTRSAGDATYLALYKEALNRVGIDIEITQKDFATWMREVGEFNFEVTMSAYSGSLALFRDPEGMWASWYADTKNGSNLPGYKNPEIDALIRSQRDEFSVAKRSEILRKIDAIVTADVPNILTWNVDSTRLLYWNKFGVPDSVLGKYGDELNIPVYWWYDADSARELKAAMEQNLPLPGRPATVDYDHTVQD